MRGPLGKGEGTGRVEAFSDGVFAIAITLLVLNLHVPELPPDARGEDLLAALGDDLTNLQAYVVSFLVVGLFWMTHHRVFAQIRRYDAVRVWLNLLTLLFVSVIPFPTAILGRYGGPVALRLYDGTLAAASILLLVMWVYASGRCSLTEPGLSPNMVRYLTLRGVVTVAIFVGSIVLSYFDDDVALLSLLLIPPAMAVLARMYGKESAHL
ncbi:MAG TPA: TMEM175 family protein [Chloroflexota bacterium]|jgi:uncharacterized membrane protein